MTDTHQLPEPELGYIKTDKSNQPAFSARQMREAMKHTNQLPPAEMTNERAAFEEWATNEGKWPKAVDRDHNGCYLLLQTSYAWTVWQARAILALRPVQVPMTDEQADALATEAFDEYMCDLNDDIDFALVRKVEAHHGITAQAKKETP